MLKVCITGHRPNNLYGYRKKGKYEILGNTIFNLIEKLYIQSNRHITLINGGALGADQIFALESINLKNKYKYNNNAEIKLVLVKPCLQQDKLWQPSLQNRYKEICSHMDEIITINQEYTKSCMKERNMYMVDNSDIVIAVKRDNVWGGTQQCFKYALSKGKEIILINPETLLMKRVNK